MPRLLSKLFAVLDDRTGIPSGLRALGATPVPGGPRWAYVFGAALTATLLIQIATGALLCLYYVPSAEHANSTVEFIQKAVPLGWLVRGLHAYGSTAVILALLLHLAQTVVFGAYKDRREAVWLSGVVLLLLVVVLAYTGYQLPWDQRAYYSSQVAAGIAGSVPVVGEMQKQLLLGGSEIGQATLSRFFALHVAVLPLLLIAVVVAHIAFARRRGLVGATATSLPYYPRQFGRDTVAFVAVAMALVAFSYARPILVGPAMDPSVGYVARPEWFFLWTNLLLTFTSAFVGGVLIPTALVIALASVPFVDRSPAVRSRRVVVGAFALVMLALGAMTVYSLYRDANDPVIAAQEEEARKELASPFDPVQVGEPLEEPEPATTPEVAAAPAQFVENCAKCHGPKAKGRGKTGPSLLKVGTKHDAATLVKLIHNPRAFELNDKMPAFPDMSDEDARAIAEWLVSLKQP